MDSIQSLIEDLKQVFEKHQVKIYCRDDYAGTDEVCNTKIYPQFSNSEDVTFIDFSEILTESLGMKIKVVLD